MKNTIKTGAVAALLACLLGPLASAAGVQRDDFPREDGDREAKDAMEGKAPPALSVANWMNIEGDALDLASLRGKVVVLDFWGTW
jgi:hypothetical protein